jgi:hypothetical protein
LLSPEEIEAAHFTAAINAALELRRHLPAMIDEAAAKEIFSLV